MRWSLFLCSCLLCPTCSCIRHHFLVMLFDWHGDYINITFHTTPENSLNFLLNVRFGNLREWFFFKVFRWDFLNNVWNRWKMKENLLIVCLFRLLCFWEYRIPSDSRYWLIHGRNQSTLLNFICLQSFIHVSACIAWNKMVLSYLPLATRSNHDVWYLIIDCLRIWSSNFRLEKLLHAKEPAYPASGDLLSAVSDIWNPFLIEQYHRCIGETEGPSLSMTDVLHLSVSCHFLKTSLMKEGTCASYACGSSTNT